MGGEENHPKKYGVVFFAISASYNGVTFVQCGDLKEYPSFLSPTLYAINYKALKTALLKVLKEQRGHISVSKLQPCDLLLLRNTPTGRSNQLDLDKKLRWPWSVRKNSMVLLNLKILIMRQF